MKVAVVMPAYNESSRIAHAIEDASIFSDAVIVIDDASVDRTSENAKKAGAIVLRHAINRGQGAAIQTGTQYALDVIGADIIVHFDADGQMTGEEIPHLIEPIKNQETEIVLGSRFLGRDAKNMPFTRWLTLKASLLFTWLVSGLPVSDVHCGFRALSADAARKATLTIDRMAHASQVYDLIKINKIHFKEVPVTIKYSKETLRKGMSFKGGFTVLKDFFKHKFFGM